jgi:hypothetical protein
VLDERFGKGSIMNPYNYLNPVTDPAMFFGRASELQEILTGLRAGTSFAIIGGSRSGKTSLLFQMKRILLEELDRSASCVVGPVFLSTHEFPRLSPAAIYREIIRKFQDEICCTKKPDWNVEGTSLLDPKTTDEQAPALFQKILKDLLVRVSPDLRIVILLDEVDALQEYEWSRMFFLNLRNLISQSDLKGHVALLLAGTVAINQLYKVAGSPFLNVIKRVRTIVPLSPDEARELVQKPSSGRVAEATCVEILRETGGHPFLVQFIMDHLYARFRDQIHEATPADVSACVQQFFEERRDFESWTENFGDDENLVYRLIATSEMPVSKEEILSRVKDTREANRILDLLTHLGVIRARSRTSFARSGDMFRTWFFENTLTTAQPALSPKRSRATREVLRVVLASPGDVEAERDQAAAVIDKVNQQAAAEHGYLLELHRWETDSQPGFHVRGAQGVVDDDLDIENCDVLIGIFWRRFGTPTSDARSGTEHEIRTAISAWKKSGQPRIMLYFSRKPATPINASETRQWGNVLEFKEEMAPQSLLWEYRDENDFREQLHNHLVAYVRKAAQDRANGRKRS